MSDIDAGVSRTLDCLIIGGGPAGLTAAMYFARYRRNTRVIDSGESRALMIPDSHNYPGFKGIRGPVLLERLREQALLYGADLQTGRVTALHRCESGGFIAAVGDSQIRARYVLLATGLVDERPRVEGVSDDTAQVEGIRYCPICDGYEAMDRRIGVMGSFESAGKKALFLRTYSRKVLLFATDAERDAPPDTLRDLCDAGVTIAGKPDKIERLGDDKVTVLVGDGARHSLDVLYPALGCKVRSDLGLALGAACDEVGCLQVDSHQQTSVEGLYGAGDVVTDLHQLSVAIGHAAIAATDIHNKLDRNLR